MEHANVVRALREAIGLLKRLIAILRGAITDLGGDPDETA